jgi:hypothetical protein
MYDIASPIIVAAFDCFDSLVEFLLVFLTETGINAQKNDKEIADFINHLSKVMESIRSYDETWLSEAALLTIIDINNFCGEKNTVPASIAGDIVVLADSYRAIAIRAQQFRVVIDSSSVDKFMDDFYYLVVNERNKLACAIKKYGPLPRECSRMLKKEGNCFRKLYGLIKRIGSRHNLN